MISKNYAYTPGFWHSSYIELHSAAGRVMAEVKSMLGDDIDARTYERWRNELNQPKQDSEIREA